MRFLLCMIMLLPFWAQGETLIVKFKQGQISTFKNATLARAQAVVLDGQMAIIEGDYKSFANNPNVEYVERDQVFHIQGKPSTDPGIMANQKAWGLEKVQVKKMWDKGFKGAGMTIAVVDTGVDGTHPELQGRVLAGYNAITGDLIAADDQGHGTHCAGTIAGATVGMAPEAHIVPVKFLDKYGSGSLSNAIKAVDWVSKQEGIDIMSNSWGGGGFSQGLKDAFQAAKKKGIWIVAAAGNEANDNDAKAAYPANYPSILASVAATSKADNLASFSSYGLKTVRLGAPGVGIYSSVPGGKYASWDGTSMATPHVAGALALLRQQGGCSSIGINCLNRQTVRVKALKTKVKTGGRLEFR